MLPGRCSIAKQWNRQSIHIIGMCNYSSELSRSPAVWEKDSLVYFNVTTFKFERKFGASQTIGCRILKFCNFIYKQFFRLWLMDFFKNICDFLNFVGRKISLFEIRTLFHSAPINSHFLLFLSLKIYQDCMDTITAF